MIVVPSFFSIHQTTDLLSDYIGQLHCGQKFFGGERIQMVTVPFCGSGNLVIQVEGACQGKSEGFVLVRHISNPNIIQTVKIPTVTVQ